MPARSGQNLHQWVEKILYDPLFLCYAASFTTVQLGLLWIVYDSCRFRKRYLQCSSRSSSWTRLRHAPSGHGAMRSRTLSTTRLKTPKTSRRNLTGAVPTTQCGTSVASWLVSLISAPRPWYGIAAIQASTARTRLLLLAWVCGQI